MPQFPHLQNENSNLRAKRSDVGKALEHGPQVTISHCSFCVVDGLTLAKKPEQAGGLVLGVE